MKEKVTFVRTRTKIQLFVRISHFVHEQLNIHMEKVKVERVPDPGKANTRDTKVAKWRNSSDRLEVGNVGQHDMTKGV